MKREDINYFNSWAHCFKPASPAIVMQGVLEGIWIASNKDPEDIYLVYPRLIKTPGYPSIDKQFGMCPFEFSIEDGETYEWQKEGKEHAYKGRMIKSFGIAWALDKYEMRKAITKRGLELAKKHKITKEEIEALHEKYSWDDASAYNELMKIRTNLTAKNKKSNYTYSKIDEHDYKCIRAAFIPHCDPMYNWMDHPEKAGIVVKEDK